MTTNILETVHDELHKNMCLLTEVYSASKEMKQMLKKDMFVKNNKPAFQEVVSYLLNIVDHNLYQKMISSNQFYDSKTEAKFRNEVLKCINEIRAKYNVDLPVIMASNLLTPGGFKFAFFMYKLSQLAIYEYLKKTETEPLMFCPKPNSNPDITMAVLRRTEIITLAAKAEVAKYFEEYRKNLSEAETTAQSIVEELRNCSRHIRDLSKEYEKLKSDFEQEFPTYPSPTHLRESLDRLKSDWENLRQVHTNFVESGRLLTHLTGDNLVLEHKTDLGGACNKNEVELDLIEYFTNLSNYYEKQAIELPYYTSTFLNDIEQKLDDLIEKMKKLDDTVILNKQESQQAIEDISKILLPFIKSTNV